MSIPALLREILQTVLGATNPYPTNMKQGISTYYFQNESECFIGVSKHRETNESTRPQAECFYCFEVFGYPDETRSTSFGNNFSRSLSNKS